MFNSLLAFFFWKVCTFSNFERFSVENLETTSSIFLSKFLSETFLSQIIHYRDSIFTLCLKWGAFSLVCALSAFFSPFFFVFFFYWYFSWQTLTIRRITRKGEEVLIFHVFHFHLLTNIHLVYRDFYRFCLVDLFIITRLIGDETCSPQRFAFFWIFIDEIRSELLNLTFQSDMTRICAHIKLSTFYRTNTLTAILILHFILLIAIIYSRGQNKKKIVETVLWLNLQCIY